MECCGIPYRPRGRRNRERNSSSLSYFSPSLLQTALECRNLPLVASLTEHGADADEVRCPDAGSRAIFRVILSNHRDPFSVPLAANLAADDQSGERFLVENGMF